MNQVISTNIEAALKVIVVDKTEWKYLKKDFPDAVYDEDRKSIYPLGEVFFRYE